MTMVAQVRGMLPLGYWTCLIVPISPTFQPFLGFKLGNEQFCFQVMLFSINVALRVFTKLVTIIVTSLRSKGILLAAYLDDWLVWAELKQLCKDHVTVVIGTTLQRPCHSGS